VQLDELFAQADFVTVHCPLNDETRGLIGRREWALRRSSAFLINTARGGVVDEGALSGALTDGKIAGAGVDVWVVEPPPTPVDQSQGLGQICRPL
jgi:phosphoglycerate dehydrogenase-like enzyme